MQRTLSLLFVLLFLFQNLDAQYSIGWKRGLQDHGSRTTIKLTPDKGFISTFNSWSGYNRGICASCDPLTAGYNSIMVVKMDSIGKIEWSKCYTGKNNSFSTDLLVLPDGSIILIGANSSDNGFFADIPSKAFHNIFLVKLSATGELIWKKNIDNPIYNEEPARIIASMEGGFMVAATSDNPVTYSGNTSIVGTGDYYLLKFDDNGNLQWNKRYGGSAQEQIKTIQQDQQGNYVAAGWTRSNNGMVSGNPTQNVNTWMIKVNPAGDLLTQIVFDQPYKILVSDLLIDPQGSYVFAGTREKGNSVITSDVWAMKVSGTSHQIIWNKTWSPSNNAYGNRVICTDEGNYLLAASSNGNFNNLISGYQPNRDWWLLEIDTASANIVWDKSYGGHSNFYKVSMEPVGSSDRLILFGGSNANQGPTDFVGDIYYGDEDININDFGVAGYILLFRNGTPAPILPAIIKDTLTFTKFQCKPPYYHSDGKFYYRDTTFIVLRQDGNKYKVYERLQLSFNKPVITYNIDTTVCYGAIVNTISFTSNGQANILVKNQLGCDSVLKQYQVKVMPAIKYLFKDTIMCRGTMFLDSLLNDGDRIQLRKIVKNYLQCDSIYQNYNITIVDPHDVISSRDTVMCYGGIYQGINYYNNTTLVDTITTLMNCGNIPLLRKFNIIVLPKLTVDIGNDIAICSGDNTLLNATTSSSNNQYLWNNGFSQSSITINRPGTYWVRVINEHGCGASDSIIVTLKSDPDSMFVRGDTLICQNGTAILSATGGIKYAWSPASTLNCINCPEVIATPSQTTIYQVLITGNCIQQIQSVLVNVEQVAVDAGAYREIFFGDTVHLQAVGNGISFKWSPTIGLSCMTCPNPIARPQQSTQYTVMMLTTAGCTASDTVSISVSDEEGVTLGSIITPDGDGINDVIKPSNPFLKGFILEIYNSYGQPVFKTNDPAKGWDGSIGQYNGTKALSGVYFYLMEYVSVSGKKISKTGRIVLVR